MKWGGVNVLSLFENLKPEGERGSSPNLYGGKRKAAGAELN